MDISIYFASKLFVSTVVIASLFDMFAAQILRSSNYSHLLIYRRIQKPAYWSLVKFIGGERTLDFIASRTILFPLAEIVFGVSIILGIYSVGLNILLLPKFLFAVFFVLLLIVPLSLEDTTTPHAITISGTALGIISGLIGGLPGLINSVLGALAGFAILGALYLVGVLYGRLIRREGEVMGAGVITAMTMTGAFCGYPGVITAIYIGILLGGIVSLIYLIHSSIRGDYRLAYGTDIPYSPFMVLGGAIVIYILPLLPFSIF